MRVDLRCPGTFRRVTNSNTQRALEEGVACGLKRDLSQGQYDDRRGDGERDEIPQDG